MVTDQEKMEYNEKVKARYKVIGEKPLGDKMGLTAICYYSEKMYCREGDCQEMTNQAFIFKLWRIGEMMGVKMKPKYARACMHIPLCDEHIAERVAFAKTQ